MIPIHIVKRKGKIEKFDERKVYASCYAACLSCHMKKLECEKAAKDVARDVRRWMDKKPVVQSDDIFRLVAKLLKKRNKDAAFMYATHRDVS
ncbi:MAG: hypothetical protein HYY37_00780 [Candidatus Aenigmarchaeota archaeon]|nr:hypothetical protein [Candidatus Aenigmarchaeota archaeon]